jgi:hypothetical protein
MKKAEHYVRIRRGEHSYAMDIDIKKNNNYIRGQRFKIVEVDVDE